MEKIKKEEKAIERDKEKKNNERKRATTKRAKGRKTDKEEGIK